MMNLPKIYCFLNTPNGIEGVAVALSEDGCILGTHWCSNESFVSHDLGVNEDSNFYRWEIYKYYYPNGYEMEFVRNKDIKTHKRLQEAQRLNHFRKIT